MSSRVNSNIDVRYLDMLYLEVSVHSGASSMHHALSMGKNVTTVSRSLRTCTEITHLWNALVVKSHCLLATNL